MRFITSIISVFLLCICTVGLAQKSKQKKAAALFTDSSGVLIRTDTTIAKKLNDSTQNLSDSINAKPKHDPHKATIRSAILPGLGQAYNREYWKIPIVAGAVAIPTATYFYNNKWYKKTRDAYNIVANGETDRYKEIDSKLKDPTTGEPLDAESLQYYRNQFRRDKDYSVLYLLIIWGLNVVDATVFGHLKDFDVSDNLTMNVQPSYIPATKTLGVGLALNLKTPQRKTLPSF